MAKKAGLPGVSGGEGVGALGRGAVGLPEWGVHMHQLSRGAQTYVREV